LAAASLLSACNSGASAPRPVAPEPMQQTSTALAPKAATTGEKAIAGVIDLPIAKHTGGALKLTDYRGKVVVADFWGTFCPPCLKQVPQLVALHKKYKDQGLEIVGLSMDDKDKDQKLVNDFIKKFNVSYTIAYPSRIVSDAFLKGTEDETGSPPIPQLFIIGRDGKVIDHLVGERPDKGISYVEQIVAQQLTN
jgi:peroxiredoxin